MVAPSSPKHLPRNGIVLAISSSHIQAAAEAWKISSKSLKEGGGRSIMEKKSIWSNLVLRHTKRKSALRYQELNDLHDCLNRGGNRNAPNQDSVQLLHSSVVSEAFQLPIVIGMQEMVSLYN